MNEPVVYPVNVDGKSPPTRSVPTPEEVIAKQITSGMVFGPALLSEARIMTSKAGKPRVEGVVSTKSGSTEFADFQMKCEEFIGRDAVVIIEGSASTYKDKLQIHILECREDESIRPIDMVPDVGFADEEWADCLAKSRSLVELSYPETAKIWDAVLQKYGSKLRSWPAARRNHHAGRGGLALHTCTMLRQAMQAIESRPDLDAAAVLLGILCHDLGKIWELSPIPGKSYTKNGDFLGHIYLGAQAVSQIVKDCEFKDHDFTVHLLHIILSHHGRLEYGSPVPPATAEAQLVHSLDMLDSSVRMVEESRGDGHWHPSLGRVLYKSSRKNGPVDDGDGLVDDDGDAYERGRLREIAECLDENNRDIPDGDGMEESI